MSTLFIVPTPIGNLKDITLRAVEILGKIKFIVCEDTRVAKKLLNLLNISILNKKFISYYEPRETELTPKVISVLLGNDAALITDSGTPLISDPGYRLLKEIREEFPGIIKIEILPGPTSITTALLASGLPTDKFTFLGFLPPKQGKKQILLESLKEHGKILKTTYIAFESPHRIEKTLRLMDNVFQNCITLSICRELTKKFESIYKGTPQELLELIKKQEMKIKGEFVIVFSLQKPKGKPKQVCLKR